MVSIIPKCMIGPKGVMSMEVCQLPALLLVVYRRAVSWVPFFFLCILMISLTACGMLRRECLSAKTVADLKLAVTSELNNLTCWLRANRLSLNVAKTELMINGSRQRLHAQCDEIDICIDER